MIGYSFLHEKEHTLHFICFSIWYIIMIIKNPMLPLCEREHTWYIGLLWDPFYEESNKHKHFLAYWWRIHMVIHVFLVFALQIALYYCIFRSWFYVCSTHFPHLFQCWKSYSDLSKFRKFVREYLKHAFSMNPFVHIYLIWLCREKNIMSLQMLVYISKHVCSTNHHL